MKVLTMMFVLLIRFVDVSTTTLVVRKSLVLVVVSRTMFVDVDVTVTLIVRDAVRVWMRLIILVLVTRTRDVLGTTIVTSRVDSVQPDGSRVSVAASQNVAVTVVVRVTLVVGLGHDSKVVGSSSIPSPQAPYAGRQP